MQADLQKHITYQEKEIIERKILNKPPYFDFSGQKKNLTFLV